MSEKAQPLVVTRLVMVSENPPYSRCASRPFKSHETPPTTEGPFELEELCGPVTIMRFDRGAAWAFASLREIDTLMHTYGWDDEAVLQRDKALAA